MEYNETNIELLLPRYCEGIATVEEQRLVKDWMKESEENRRIVKQMEILYLAADTVHVINNVNTEKALVKVKGKKTERGGLVGVGTACCCRVISPTACYFFGRTLWWKGCRCTNVGS